MCAASEDVYAACEDVDEWARGTTLESGSETRE